MKFIHTEKFLKEKLEKVKENNYVLRDEQNAYELAKEMLNHIGSIDPVLRDDLIFSIFSKWIKDDVFTFDQLQNLLSISIDDKHLFYKLGEINHDSVFTRSFSLLVIAAILSKNNEKEFLISSDFENVKQRLFHYAVKENDIRGYVEEKGWAHTIAHLADCLDELAKNLKLKHIDLQMILKIINFRIIESENVHVCEEDERLVTVVCAVLERNILSEDEIEKWIMSFINVNATGEYVKDLNVKINSKHFLRSFYFRLNRLEDDRYSLILRNLEKLNNY